MVDLPEVPMKMRSRSGVALVTLLFILMGAAFLTQVVPYRQILDSQRQVDAAQEQLASLEAENEVLSAMSTPSTRPRRSRRLARDKLGYVREGEVAYVVLDPPGADTAPPLPASSLRCLTRRGSTVSGISSPGATYIRPGDRIG